jgi:hypothetical protein
MPETKVKVRVQANGGKYLGAAVAATPPALTVRWDGGELGPLTFPTSNSGVICPKGGSTASPHTITVDECAGAPGYKPGTYFLLPSCDPFTDPALIVSLPITGTVEVTFNVTAYAPQPVEGSVTVSLTAGEDYTADPGVIVVVSGLRLTAQVAITGLQVTANVTMMCGCAITPNVVKEPAAEPYWPACEFVVTAQDALGMNPAVELECTGTSTFTGTLTSPVPMGEYVIVKAEQPKLPGNTNATKVMVPA